MLFTKSGTSFWGEIPRSKYWGEAFVVPLSHPLQGELRDNPNIARIAVHCDTTLATSTMWHTWSPLKRCRR